MVASSSKLSEDSQLIAGEGVGSESYLARHNSQMFEEGRSFSGNERDKVFFGRPDGSFADLSDLSGADSPNDGRAVIAADFDDDGDLDLFVHNIQRERHALYRNELGTSYGGYLKVRLKATTSQYEAIGAVVRVSFEGGERAVAQVLSRGAGFSSCQPPELVFGLGAATSVRVEVDWPGGSKESFGEIARNSRVTLVEGSARPQAFAQKKLALPDPLPAGLMLGVGQRVPVLSVLDAEGNSVRLDPRELAAGKPLVISFWASYCAPCVAELPDLAAMHAAGEQRIVAINVDAPSQVKRARNLLARRAPDLTAFYLESESASETARGDPSGGSDKGSGAGLVRGLEQVVDLDRLPIPTSLLLSPEGVIEGVHRGPLKAD